MSERRFCGLRGSCRRRNDGLLPVRPLNSELLPAALRLVEARPYVVSFQSIL